MFDLMKRAVLGTGIACLAVMAEAKDLALVLGNGDYRHLSNPGGAQTARQVLPALRDAEFQVFSALNADAAEARAAAEGFAAAAGDATRVLVLIAGHVASSGREAWLLGTDARAPGLFSAGQNALPLGPLLDIAGDHQGRAIVMIADAARPLDLPAGLRAGAGALRVPQGVSLVTGPGDALSDLAAGRLLKGGVSLDRALRDAGGAVQATGFVSNALVFLPAPGNGNAAEINPVRNPGEAAEDALNLDRDQRREIQRSLSILGYNTRGIDGIFGAGTRAAIRNWQTQAGLTVTGYLTGNQVQRLDVEARRRARELAEEAERRRLEAERDDRAWWDQTGTRETEAGYRAYLKRYPDGLYSDIASARLKDIEDDKRNRAATRERRAWDRARAEDTAEAYRAYLESYPNGAFEDEAQERLEELEAEASRSAEIAAAKEEEARVAGGPITGLLVENRLAALGYEPGVVDGAFDRATRKAIRRFQSDRGLSVTGFVTEATMVQLLARY